LQGDFSFCSNLVTFLAFNKKKNSDIK